jgi:hypothetical protein
MDKALSGADDCDRCVVTVVAAAELIQTASDRVTHTPRATGPRGCHGANDPARTERNSLRMFVSAFGNAVGYEDQEVPRSQRLVALSEQRIRRNPDERPRGRQVPMRAFAHDHRYVVAGRSVDHRARASIERRDERRCKYDVGFRQRKTGLSVRLTSREYELAAADARWIARRLDAVLRYAALRLHLSTTSQPARSISCRRCVRTSRRDRPRAPAYAMRCAGTSPRSARSIAAWRDESVRP